MSAAPPDALRALRFGVLCDGPGLLRWQRRCLEQLEALPGVTAVLRLTWPGASRPPTAAARLFHRWLDQRAPGCPGSREDWPAFLAALPMRNLAATDGALLEGLDFLLSFADTPELCAWSERPRLGVWVLRFGDWTRFRGEPAGFWEVHTRCTVSGAVLARLTTDPQVIVPLRRGAVDTRLYSYAANRDQLWSRFTHWPAQLCRELQTGETAGLQAAPLRGGTARGLPGACTTLAHRARMLWRVATHGLASLLRHERWNIGIVHQPIAAFLDPARAHPPIEWLPPRPRHEFVADPFGLRVDGQLLIYCEILDYRDGVGRIAALSGPDWRVTTAVHIGPQPPVHLSYPYLLEVEGRVLCVPESQAAGEVALYARERHADGWTRVATLVSGLSIVDATVFRHDGRWWLAGAADPGSTRLGADLHLWYADGIEGPWRAHPGNPVKTDVGGARPAGTPFLVAGALYRPAQDSSTRYGSRVVIQRVGTLTPHAFYEEPAAVVEPDPAGPYPEGLHTLSAIGDLTLVDGKRSLFSAAELRRSLGRMLRRRLSR